MSLEEYLRCRYPKDGYTLRYRGRIKRGPWVFRLWLVISSRGTCHGTLEIYETKPGGK